MKRGLLLFALPPVILILGVVVAAGMIKSRKPAETRSANIAVPLVTVRTVHPTDYRFEVASQGSVIPRTQIALTAEVSGRAVEVSPDFVSGGFFGKGDVLARLESVDYRAALSQARAALTRAELRLAQEEAQAAVAVREWQRLGEGEASPLTTRELHVAEARASADAARAAVAQAEKNLERTAIRAPFTGRVRSESIDVGQFVPMGTPIAQIYAVDYAEVRLPLPADDVAFADLPLGHGDPAGTPVTLSAETGGLVQSWKGTIVRTEGEIDARSRVLYAVARIDNPYDPQGGRPPLAVGQFVTASILGKRVEDVYVIPRSALRGGNRVLIVDGDQLRIRTVEVLRLQGEEAILSAGLEPGTLLCVSPVEAPVDGMTVRTAPDDTAPPDAIAREDS